MPDVIRYIVISKRDYTLTGYTDEQHLTPEVGPWPCTVGGNSDRADKQAEGDCRTPEGRHLIIEIIDSSSWRCDGVLAYGAWFLRLKGQTDRNAQWTGIGIHGHAAGEEAMLGGIGSHGCVRIANANIEMLRTLVVPGETIVNIIPI